MFVAARRITTASFAALEEGAWRSADVAAAYELGFSRVTARAIPPLLAAVAAPSSGIKPDGRALLDVACGLGALTQAAVVSGQYSRVVGTDFSAAMIAKAASGSKPANSASERPAAEWVQADASQLPFETSSFDAVTCAFGVLHLPDPPSFFAEAARVLKPDGRFAFTVWCPPPATQGYKIMLDATSAHAVDLPAGPPMFQYAEHANVLEALSAVGFEPRSVRTAVHDMVWEVDSAASFWNAVQEGTARTRAHIAALDASQREEVRQAVLQACEEYTCPDGRLRLKMPCVVSSATRSASVTASR